MGGQTDSEVGSQAQASHKMPQFYAHTNDLRSTRVYLRWVTKLCKTCIDLHANLSASASACVDFVPGGQMKRTVELKSCGQGFNQTRY